MASAGSWSDLCPQRMGLADDFVQLGFGIAAAEGEGSGEMSPILQRQAVMLMGDEYLQRSALLLVAGEFQVYKATLTIGFHSRSGLILVWIQDVGADVTGDDMGWDLLEVLEH